jgi:[acyl-carrier-protein] S-malonyltransferase
MQDAVDEVAKFASSIQARDPKVAIWSNFDGSRVDSGEKFLELIVRQISRPVRWDLCMESVNIEGCKFVELPPAGALAGLIKRGADKVLGIAIKSPADVEKVSA